MAGQSRDTLARRLAKLKSDRPARWRVSPGLTDYEQARAFMRAHSARMARGEAGELVWLLEHPPLYTAGTSARAEELLDPGRFPVYRTGRGGRFAYHGPGQRVIYLMLDLRRRGRDIRAYVTGLEQMTIDALGELGAPAGRREDRVGVWVRRPGPDGERDEKIAAIGVRVSRWITRHGAAINVRPDLSHYGGIVPCGLSAHGVTSLAALGRPAEMSALDAALKRAFGRIFGPLRPAGPFPPET